MLDDLSTGMNVRSACSGVTLLEMLVTLLIVAMVTGLGFQMVAYLTRIESMLADTTLGGSPREIHREWVRQLLLGLQPQRPGDPGDFRGEASRLKGRSAIRPGIPEGGGEFSLDIVFNSDNGHSELVYRDERVPRTVLMDWEGGGGEFVFIDRKNVEHSQWPPVGEEKVLPGAIVMRPRAPAYPLVVTIGNTAAAMSSRRSVVLEN